MSPTSPDTPSKSARSDRWPVLAGLLLSLLLLGTTALYWKGEKEDDRSRRAQTLDAAADRISHSLQQRMDVLEIVLRGVKGYYDGSVRIDRAEFQAYVSALHLQNTLPGLQGVAYVLQLPATGLTAHAQGMREKGFADYRVFPEGLREHYTPISHIEPLTADNAKALGFDVSTIPGAREALERARDTGELTLTSAVTLRQDMGKPPTTGLVMYLPIYAAGTDERSLEARRAGIVGWVSAPFRMREMVQGMAGQLDTDIDLAIYDGPSPTETAALYRSEAVRSSEPQELRQITLGGRTWTLAMQPLPAFESRFDGGGQHLNAVLGMALSLLVGGLTWVLATGRERAVAMARDMTQALRSTRDDLESTLNAIPDLLFELDADGRILHWRSARSGLLAMQSDQVLGKRLPELVPPEAAPGCRAALEAARDTGYSAGQQFWLELGPQIHWFELSMARKDSAQPGQGLHFVALARDITERKQAEARTHQLAYFDALTGLPNRRMLLDRLDHGLAMAHRLGRVGALLFIDLDNFKQINDARGHSLGDALLAQVAQRLTQMLRPEDTVARLGGDEFVLLVSDIAPDIESAGRNALLLGEEVRAALEMPYTIDGHLYGSAASIGITLFPKQGEAIEDLLREADTAMYRAKDLGRNRISFYEAAMQSDVQERLALEQDLKIAQTEGQLAVHLQPQVDGFGTVVGGELLLRWNHPVRGSVPPSCFIPVAESSGLILRMGDWVLQQACTALARLQAAGCVVPLSVNVSQRQFRQDHFVDRLRELFAQTGAPPEHLILEVTESLLIENLDDTIARMTELVRMGVRFSIDDFGTGYSSLAYLKRLPLYELKIDKSFVQDAPDDPNDTAIVASILSVARHLKLRVVAEGVETRAQADFLIASRCDYLQGYLFGRPEPLEPWVQRRMAGAA